MRLTADLHREPFPMPVHDWSRVDAGIFHDFHASWITHLMEAVELRPPSRGLLRTLGATRRIKNSRM